MFVCEYVCVGSEQDQNRALLQNSPVLEFKRALFWKALLQKCLAKQCSFAAHVGLFCKTALSWQALLQNSLQRQGSFACFRGTIRQPENKKTTVITKPGLFFCKRALQDQGSHAKEPFKYMALLQKSSTNIGFLSTHSPANIGLFCERSQQMYCCCA